MSIELETCLNDLADTKSLQLHPHFAVASSSTIAVPNNSDVNNLNSSALFTGFVGLGSLEGFTLRASDGAVQNSSGRNIPTISGTISFQILASGGGGSNISDIYLWSEESLDGVTFTPVPGGLRAFRVTSNGSSFRSTLSFTTDWANNKWIRWKIARIGTITVTLDSLTGSSNGQGLTSRSVVWALQENG